MIVVIGNGNSREDLNLDEINKKAITFGCNALYRNFSPDYLLSVDAPITHEILSTDYVKNNNLYLDNVSFLPAELRNTIFIENIIENSCTNYEFLFNGYEDNTYITWVPENHKIKNLPWKEDNWDWSAGLLSIRLAHELFPDEEIYLIGFDIFGDRNNIYDGTNAYPSVGTKNLMEQKFIVGFKLLFDLYPNINIKRVINQNKQIDGIPNISKEELWQKIQNSQKI